MKVLHTTLLLLCTILLLLSLSPAQAATGLQDVRGAIMSAETNKPVVGAEITFFIRNDNGIAASPSARARSDNDGAYRVSLPSGSFAWFVKAEGLGTMQSGMSVAAKPVDLGPLYLRKPAELSGRLVDGTGTPVAGIPIRADNVTTSASAEDGRFRFTGLDPHGYEPALNRPGWVLEKSAYYYLGPGEKKDLGDLVIRHAAELKVRIAVREKGKTVLIDKIRVNLGGNTIYRSVKTDKDGVALLTDLPPGHYAVSAPDERLKESRRGVDIKEGINSELTIEAELKPPALSIEEYSEVFLPGKPVKLRANSLRVEKAEAIITLVSASLLLDGSVDLRQPDSIPAGAVKKVISIPVSFKTRRDSYSRFGRIPLPGLQPGAYLLELKGGGAAARFGFLVTRLGLVAKVSPAGTLLFATDLVNGKPLAGVGINVFSPAGGVTTDASGFATWKGAESTARLVGKLGNSLAFLDLPNREDNGKSTGIKGYIYTDRPVYRPSQSVFYKGVLRRRSGEEYTLPRLDKVHVEVKDDNDKTVCASDLTVTATGSFTSECILPPVPALGEYSITAGGAGESWQGSFRVLEYRKPEFEVRPKADRQFLVAGDTGLFKVSARYYYGAPVAGGKLLWRLYSKPAWGLGAGSDDDGYDEDRHSDGGYADFIGEGEAKLDDNGEVSIPVTAKTHDMPSTYTLETDVTDASSRQVSASESVTVVPSLVSLNVKAANYLARPGEPQEIILKAASWEGAALSLPLRLGFGRQVYDKKSRSYIWQESESSSISTAADGSARARFSFPKPGYWQVRAEGADEAGRKTVATTSVWVWKAGFSWEGSYRDLEAEFDRKSYRPGEIARLIVRSPVTGGSLLLTLEGREIAMKKVVPLKEMVEVVEIPVTEALAPSIHVSAVAVGAGRFFSRTLPLRVDLQPGRLDLKVTADKPVHAPGDPVRLTISSSMAGQTVPAELSLAVVDESIFAIAKERPDDIWQFFRGTREHLVTTLHSFPRVYLGGASKEKASAMEADDGLKGLKVRKTFKDTAAWFPMLVSQPNGNVTADFTLPDNLTTWRATAVGHARDSDFGVGREKFIARLELMARLAPPRFLTVGDELRIPGVISSMIDKEQSATGRFEAQGLTLLGDPAFSGSIAPRSTLKVSVNLRADSAGRATLRLLAAGNEKGDAMELTLPVLPRSITREVGGGIALRDTEGQTELILPVEALPGTAQLKLFFSPTIAASLNSAITRLVEFPYGCVEQTLSRFIPAVHARSLLNKTGWLPDPATETKLPLVIAEGIRRLEEMQHEDGGWGWWKNDSTSLTMTAHTVYGLGLAVKAGLAVPDTLLKRGITALEKLAADAPTDQLPRAYRALAVNGVRKADLEQKVGSLWKSLPLSEQLAYGEALGLIGARKDMLEPIIGQLKKEIQDEGQVSYLKDTDSESWWYGRRWGSSAVETTAAMLSLMVKQDAGDPMAVRLAGFLSRRRESGWWHTTTASAAAVTALADYVAASGEATAGYTAKLSLNGNELASWLVENGRIVTGDAQLTVPANILKNGVNRISLTKSAAAGAAYLAAGLEYQAAPESARPAAGLKLERTFYRVATVKSGDVWRREYTPLKPDEILEPGNDIEVRLIVENRQSLEYVIVEDRLPAGFESRETDRDPRFSGESGYGNWFSHRERRDEKLAFFITGLPAGRHEFRHAIYPELEGKVIALPAAVWPMYQPELRGESAAWRMDIKGP
ncbi:MAG: MG2 domain-containing protein [Desulfuromonadales bacterium]